MSDARWEPCFEGARRFWYTMRRWWWSAYWRLEVEGARNVPASGAALLCGNHASHLDAPAILAALPRPVALRVATAAAKDVFADHPVRNVFARVMTNAFAVERNAGFSRGLRTIEDILRRGRPVILFPEGRRSPDGSLLKFNLGAAMLAIHTGAPIVPVRLQGVLHALPRRRLLPAPSRVRVRFGAPIDPAPFRAAVEEGRMERKEAYRTLTESLRSAVAGMGKGLSNA